MEWVTLLKGLFVILVIAGSIALPAALFNAGCYAMDRYAKATKGKKLWSK